MNGAGAIHQKIPTTRSAPAFVKQRVLDEIKKRGYGLPCHLISRNAQLVTVAFDLADVSLEQVTIPIMGSQYQRVPFEEGTFGFTVALAVDISFVAGLGTGLPSLSQLPANLTSLFWFPAGRVDFPAVDDPNKYVIYGPNGFEVRDSANQVSIVGDVNSGITMSFNGHILAIKSDGIYLDGIKWDTHSHLPGTYQAPDGAVTGEAGLPKSP